MAGSRAGENFPGASAARWSVGRGRASSSLVCKACSGSFLVRFGDIARHYGRAGLTLLELLAVLAIIAALTGVVIGVGRHAYETGKVARARAELAGLSAALESYRGHHGDYPRTGGNATLVQSLIGRLDPDGSQLAAAGRPEFEVAKFAIALPDSTDHAVDPFSNLAAVLLDPWGQPYRYAYRTQTPWTNPSFVLYSIGPDGADNASLLAGGFIDGTPRENADNLYANRS